MSLIEDCCDEILRDIGGFSMFSCTVAFAVIEKPLEIPNFHETSGFCAEHIFMFFLSELKVGFCSRRMKFVNRFAVHQAIDVSLPDELEILKLVRRGSVLAEYDRYAASEKNADDVSHLRAHRCQAKIVSLSRFEEFSVPNDALHSP